MSATEQQGNAQAVQERTEEIIVKAKVPLFRGGLACKDTLSTLAWCEAVDRQRTQQEWSDEKAALAAVDAFREGVAEWYRVVKEEKPDEVTRWTTLRALIITRFGQVKSMAQRVAMLANLTQKANETTEGFYDRVAGAYYEVLRSTQDALTAPDKAAKIAGFKTSRDELLKLTYVAGLRNNIREGVEARLTSKSDLAWIREAAAAMEIATARKKTVAAVSYAEATSKPATTQDQTRTDLQALVKAEVAAVARSQARGGGQNRPDHSRPRKAQVTEATKRLGPMGDRGWIYCSRCCQWGLHIRPECTWAMTHIKTIPKMDRNEKPTGTPRDQQYPNA